MKKDYLYNYVFHYNCHEKMWWAIPRERYLDYWNGDKKGLLRSEYLDQLKLIIKNS